MKKTIYGACATVFMLSSLSSFAQNWRPSHPQSEVRLEREVRMLSRAVKRQVQDRADTLSKRELRQLKKTLQAAINILSSDLTPAPLPPAPRRTCDKAPKGMYQNNFNKIQNFAHLASGLNYRRPQAKKFAREWMTKYPCRVADKYIEDFKVIKEISYYRVASDFIRIPANQYALNNIDFYCSGVNLVAEFTRHYHSVFSGRRANRGDGRANRGDDRARVYAQTELEKMAFVCQNFTR